MVRDRLAHIEGLLMCRGRQLHPPKTLHHQSRTLPVGPAGTLYRKHSLVEIAAASSNDAALACYKHRNPFWPWALYRMRRIYVERAESIVQSRNLPRTLACLGLSRSGRPVQLPFFRESEPR